MSGIEIFNPFPGKWFHLHLSSMNVSNVLKQIALFLCQHHKTVECGCKIRSFVHSIRNLKKKFTAA